MFHPSFVFQVASLAYDRLGIRSSDKGNETDKTSNVLKQLYENESFREFLRRILDLPELHRLADPLGACSINIFR